MRRLSYGPCMCSTGASAGMCEGWLAWFSRVPGMHVSTWGYVCVGEWTASMWYMCCVRSDVCKVCAHVCVSVRPVCECADVQ